MNASAIFDYEDYRRFLSDWFSAKKSENPKFSGAVFARRAGLSSHAFLGMVIRGDRNLTASSIAAFARGIGFGSKEGEFFERLVYMNQARSAQERGQRFAQLLKSARRRELPALDPVRDTVRYLSHWYHLAIVELTHCHDFQEDPDWISRRLKRRVSRKEAEEALATLVELGALQRNPKSRQLEPKAPVYDIERLNVDFALMDYHRQALDLGRDLLERESFGEREFSSLVIAVTPDRLEALRARLRDLRKELNSEFSVGSREATAVVMVNCQLLKVSADGESFRDPSSETTISNKRGKKEK